MSGLFDEEVGVTEWFKLLGWISYPDLGNCHSLLTEGRTKEFDLRYYSSDELKEFASNLKLKLQHTSAAGTMMLVQGNPGIGKTTFLFTLLDHATKDKQLNAQYKFYICHANNAKGENWRYQILEKIKESLFELYEESEQGNVFDRLCCEIVDSEQGLAAQVLELKNYVFNPANKGKFSRTLVFILDNIDTIDDANRLMDIFEFINSTIEPGGIKKWLIVRPETLEKFTSKQLTRIDSFVTNHEELPLVSLHKVIEKRILNTTGSSDFKKINPFSKELCDELILPVCDGSIRAGMDVLAKLLELRKPKGFSVTGGQSERALQTYIRTGVTAALYVTKKIPDLHKSKFRVTSLETPLVFDLLNLINFASNPTRLKGLLHTATERRNQHTRYLVSGRTRTFTIQPSEFNEAIRILIENKLVYSNSDRVFLTEKGKSFINLATPIHYAGVCRDRNADRSDNYWQIASVDVTYSSVVTEFTTREKIW